MLAAFDDYIKETLGAVDKTGYYSEIKEGKWEKGCEQKAD